jgi:hypothetical protein
LSAPPSRLAAPPAGIRTAKAADCCSMRSW